MSLKSESFCETEDEEKYEPGKSCEKRDETKIEVRKSLCNCNVLVLTSAF